MDFDTWMDLVNDMVVEYIGPVAGNLDDSELFDMYHDQYTVADAATWIINRTDVALGNI